MRTTELLCVAVVPVLPTVITEHIADVERWPEFRGYGLIPGVANARYEFRAAGQAGSRVRVRNTDGSTHTEEFLEWESGRRVLIRMSDFSAPLKWFASDFLEEWDLTAAPAGTRITRRFSLRPRNLAGRGVLLLIAPLLARAVARHMEQIGQDAGQKTHALS